MIEGALLDAGRFSGSERELLTLTWTLLHAIDSGQADVYSDLCMPDLTCFEDVCPHRIDGIEFHAALIALMAQSPDRAPRRFDMLNPHVQVYGDTGIVTYTRLQTFSDEGRPRWAHFNETRVWVRVDGRWKLAHFHRSPA